MEFYNICKYSKSCENHLYLQACKEFIWLMPFEIFSEWLPAVSSEIFVVVRTRVHRLLRSGKRTGQSQGPIQWKLTDPLFSNFLVSSSINIMLS